MDIIRFEYWIHEEEFFVEFEIPFSQHNLRAVLMMGTARNIRIVDGE
jgi:type IV secretory pathway TrbD component